MSLVLLGRAGETKVVTNLDGEVVIRVVEVRDGRVLLDVSTKKITVNPTCEPRYAKRRRGELADR